MINKKIYLGLGILFLLVGIVVADIVLTPEKKYDENDFGNYSYKLTFTNDSTGSPTHLKIEYKVDELGIYWIHSCDLGITKEVTENITILGIEQTKTHSPYGGEVEDMNVLIEMCIAKAEAYHKGKIITTTSEGEEVDVGGK